MEETEKKDASHASEKGRQDWHTAFFQAMKLELSDYRDSLEFDYNHPLTSEPLRIDLLIIKKPKDITIDKNIARIFRGNNVLEYKSPNDNLSVNDFLKVCAYANLYASITPNADFSDITLTFIESRHPSKLLQYLTEIRRYKVEETSPGIYQVSGDYLPIQVIESKRLPESENLWLKSLRNDLESRSMGAILEASWKLGSREGIGAYLDVILYANPEAFLEVHKMRTATFEEVFTEAGIIPEWIERGRMQGIEQEKFEIARKMKAADRPLTEIIQFTSLSPEAIQKL